MPAAASQLASAGIRGFGCPRRRENRSLPGEEIIAFKEFQRKRTHGGELAVTISKSGTFVVNSKVIERLFEGKRYVRLFWDAEQRKIGLMPTAEKLPTSYTVNVSRTGSAGVFSGTAFFRTYGIKHDQTKSLVATWNEEDGLLELKVH